MDLGRFLATSPISERMDMWAATATYTNWIEGRRGPKDRETWLVMCVGEYVSDFLEVARRAGVTVERIEGAGDDERYVMLVGEPGTGWNAPSLPG